MSLSAVPGIIATIREDMGTVEAQIADHVGRLDQLEEKYHDACEVHNQELRRLKAQLRDMECTARTLGEYETGAFLHH